MAFSTHDIVPDSPTNNFGTWNPLKKYEGSPVYSNGNLLAEDTVNDSDNVPVTCNFPRTGGRKWYTEFYFYDAFEHTNVSSGSVIFLVASDKTNSSLGVYGYAKEYIAGDGSTTIFQYRSTQNTMPYFDYGWGSNISQNYGIIGILIDYESNSIQFSANGQWGTAIFPMDSNAVISGINLSGKYNLENESLYVIVSHGGSDRFKVAMNCGQDPTFAGNKSPSTTYTDANGIGAFYYQPPTGALALCTANLPEMTPDVTGDVPQDYFKTVIWTGDNANTRPITDVGFQPDLVWIKDRTVANSHRIFDSVRGVNRNLISNSTSSEDVNNIYGYLSSFNSNGFTVSAGSDPTNPYDAVNKSGDDYVAWCWKAGGAPTADNTATSGAMTANSVSLNGTLQSNYTPAGSPTIYPTRMSINTDAGFSIVSWTGNGAALVDNTYQSIPTGLSGKLAFAIQKRTDTTGNWHTYHKNCSVAHTYWSAHLYLNNTLNEQIGSGYDSQVFKYTHNNGLCEFQNGDGNNVSSGEYISYFFEEVENFSKFGNYQPEQNVPFFVHLGFRPAFLMVKGQTFASSWYIFDNARNEFNTTGKTLHPDGAGTEQDFYNGGVDFVSNGFVVRGRSDTGVPNSSPANAGSPHKLIYMAFAEQPFKFSNAR